AEDGIRCFHVTGVQTCALPISGNVIRPEHLKLSAVLASTRLHQDEPDGGRSPREVIREELHRLFELPGESLFKDQEELLTREAFAWSGFNQVRSAALLGITRNAMRTLLVNHGLIKAR